MVLIGFIPGPIRFRVLVPAFAWGMRDSLGSEVDMALSQCLQP